MSYGTMLDVTGITAAGTTVDIDANIKGSFNFNENGTAPGYAYNLDVDTTTGITDRAGKAITPGNPTVSSDGILTFKHTWT